MGWNGNDIQYLSTIDRVKRLERSTLEPNESGDYDETSPNLTERVVALEASVNTLENGGINTIVIDSSTPFTIKITDIVADKQIKKFRLKQSFATGGSISSNYFSLSYDETPRYKVSAFDDIVFIRDDSNSSCGIHYYDIENDTWAFYSTPTAFDTIYITGLVFGTLVEVIL